MRGRTRMPGMPTLRRILKYVPAVVLGLLVVAWVASIYVDYWLDIPAINVGHYVLGVESGSLYFGFNDHPFPLGFYTQRDEFFTTVGFGRFACALDRHPDGSIYRWWFDCPIACAATALLPLAIGPFVSFRFRLWHYLAYTALVAVELAYYLRWQE